MRTPIKIMKQEFIKKWTLALKVSKFSSKEMNVMDKAKVIKQTAAIAMAAANGGSKAWSRAIIAREYHQNNKKDIVEAVILSSKNSEKLMTSLINLRSKSSYCISSFNKMIIRRSKKVTRRRSSSAKKVVKASSLAKNIIKKRTQMLQRLVPGGEAMNELSLIEEALDYIVSLKAQVDVMRDLVNAAEHMKQS